MGSVHTLGLDGPSVQVWPKRTPRTVGRWGGVELFVWGRNCKTDSKGGRGVGCAAVVDTAYSDQVEACRA